MRYVYWAMTLAIMVFIFINSSQTAEISSQTSSSFTEKLLTIFYSDFSDLSEMQRHILISSLQHFIRKAAHFSVFFALAFSCYLALNTYNIKIYIKMLLTVTISVLYALSDEIHQLFSEGRACQFSDIIIDTAGAVCGMFLAVGLAAVYNKLRKRGMLNEKKGTYH